MAGEFFDSRKMMCLNGRCLCLMMFFFFFFNMQPSKCFNDEKFKVLAKRWHDSGAKLIGGCCRTTPSTIRGLSKVLKKTN